MSSIVTNIQGTDASYSIDVDQMRQRLETMQTYLQKAIEAEPPNVAQLQDRLGKVNSQIDRLDRLAGKTLEISPERARMELDRGIKYLTEGENILNAMSNYLPPDSQAAGKVSSWLDHLQLQRDRLDLIA